MAAKDTKDYNQALELLFDNMATLFE